MRNSVITLQKPSRTVFSHVHKRKVLHFFNVLDIDRNGILQAEDFVNVGQKIIDKLGMSDQSRHGRLILLKAHRLFVQLLTDVQNPDMELTLWDWVDFFRTQIESEEASTLYYYIHRTSRHIFDLFDTNRDQKISKEEYADMLAIYNMPHDTATKGFKELDTDNDDQISMDELTEGLRNFFCSGSSEARGNFIFGDWR